MAARKPDPTPLATFLAPLARLAISDPQVEGQVVWASAAGWQDQSDTTDLLDAEEIAFYAEGLLLEGFQLHWQLLAENGAPRFARLFFWQDQPPAPIPLPIALTLLAEGRWPIPPA